MEVLAPNFDVKELTRRLVQAESPSGDGPAIRAVLRILAEALPEGLSIRWHETSRGPILEAGRGTKGCLVLGHADTVWPKGTLAEMPWREEEGRVYGPGVLDMKAGLALAVGALYEVRDEVPFTFLVTPDEEIGSVASRPLIEARAREAPLVLVLEAGARDGGLKIGRAGVGDFHLTIQGIESHAGLEPDQGVSAIRELAQQTLWLSSLENRLLGTTVNVGIVEGGTRTNVVAGRAHAYIDIRVQTPREMDRIIDTLSAPPRFEPKCRVFYRGQFNRPPMEPNPAMQFWLDQAARRWKQRTGRSLPAVRVGAASDGNFTAPLAPTLDGLGAIGQGPHARHEHVVWEHIGPRMDLVRYLVEKAGQSS